MKSKAWNWETVNSENWQAPSREYYYLADRWSRQKFNKILDLGCGLGRHAIAFALDGFEVSGCDLSEYGVEYARNNAVKLGVKGIDFKVCDMLKLEYPDSYFDAVFAYHVVSHTDTSGISIIIAEIQRVLRSGGEAFFDIISKDSSLYKNATNHIDNNTIIMEEIKEEYGIQHYFATIDEVIELLKNFTIIDITRKATFDTCAKPYPAEHFMCHIKKK